MKWWIEKQHAKQHVHGLFAASGKRTSWVEEVNAGEQLIRDPFDGIFVISHGGENSPVMPEPKMSVTENCTKQTSLSKQEKEPH